MQRNFKLTFEQISIVGHVPCIFTRLEAGRQENPLVFNAKVIPKAVVVVTAAAPDAYGLWTAGMHKCMG